MTVALRDGSRVVIRPIEPDDRDALAAGFERLSPESRYRRFFGPMQHLSESYLDYLTQVDHHDHEALVASTRPPATASGSRATCARAPRSPSRRWWWTTPGRGAGRPARCWTRSPSGRARRAIARFEAPVLASNRDAIAVLTRLGSTTQRPDGREINLTIDLPSERGVRLPWRGLLKEVATGTIEPGRTLIERIWPRRAGAPDDERRNVIVVGTDGSDHALAAIDTAASLAADTNATVDIVGAHRFLPPDQTGITAAVSDAAGTLRDRGLNVNEHVRRGDPALVLTDIAAEKAARLIVVGAGDRGKTTRRIIGSVADFVAERSPCDVLIVRPREPA